MEFLVFQLINFEGRPHTESTAAIGCCALRVLDFKFIFVFFVVNISSSMSEIGIVLHMCGRNVYSHVLDNNKWRKRKKKGKINIKQ